MQVKIEKILEEIQYYSQLHHRGNAADGGEVGVETILPGEIEGAYKSLSRLDDFSSGTEMLRRLDEARDELKRLLKVNGAVSPLHIRLIISEIQDLRDALETETED